MKGQKFWPLKRLLSVNTSLIYAIILKSYVLNMCIVCVVHLTTQLRDQPYSQLNTDENQSDNTCVDLVICCFNPGCCRWLGEVSLVKQCWPVADEGKPDRGLET